MRIGFIKQLHWSRYGDFWQSVVKDTDSEAVFAKRDSVLESLTDSRLEPIQSISFKLAAAEAIALADCDLLIAPDLNQNKDFSKGSGKDPWIANFPETLQKSIKPSAEVFAIPTIGAELSQQKAIELLMKLSHNPKLSKLVLQSNLAKLKNKKYADRVIDKPGYSKALIGQSWLVEKLNKAVAEKLHLQTDIKPEILINEAYKEDSRLLETDAEVLGAARLFNRKASLSEIVFLADKNSAADLWLNRRAAKTIRKDFKTVFIQDLARSNDLLDYFLAE